MKTFQAKCGYSQERYNIPKVGTYRSITLEEAKSLRYGQRHLFIDIKGNVRELKINGAPKTWKRDKSRIEIPCKYGMYEYYTFGKSDYDRLVVLVDD